MPYRTTDATDEVIKLLERDPMMLFKNKMDEVVMSLGETKI